jgi:hypothetical protein
MEIKAGIKSLSKLIPTSNNIEMAKAVEYDSKFEGGARVLVELPNNPNEIVEPKLVDGNVVSKTLDTAFDFVDEVEENEEIIVKEESIAIKEESITIKEEVPIVHIETIKQDYSTDKQENFENDDEDISFDFPDNDEDDDEVEEDKSNLF